MRAISLLKLLDKAPSEPHLTPHRVTFTHGNSQPTGKEVVFGLGSLGHIPLLRDKVRVTTNI